MTIKKIEKHNRRLKKGHESIQEIGEGAVTTSEYESTSVSCTSIDCTILIDLVTTLEGIEKDLPAALDNAREDRDNCLSKCGQTE